MAEAGVPDMAFSVWMGLFVPTGTPTANMSRLRDDVTRILAMPDVRERFAGLGVDPSGMGTEAFTKIIADDIARWTAVAKAGNIKAQ
jgi:tripartite-type tricarboxylate transporter receptor subunit TctC